MASTGGFVAPTGKGAPATKPASKAPAAKPVAKTPSSPAKAPATPAPAMKAAAKPVAVKAGTPPAPKQVAKSGTTAAPKPASPAATKPPAAKPVSAKPAAAKQVGVKPAVAKPAAAKLAAPVQSAAAAKPATAAKSVTAVKANPAAPVPAKPKPVATAPAAKVAAAKRAAAPEVVANLEKGYVITGSHSAELKLFGAPDRELAQMKKNITAGTVLFLFNAQTLKLTGTFVAESVPDNNIVADAFGGKAPAQVRAKPLETPLMEVKLAKRIFGGPKQAADVAKLREELAAGAEADAATQEAWGGGLEPEGPPPAKKARMEEAAPEVEEVAEEMDVEAPAEDAAEEAPMEVEAEADAAEEAAEEGAAPARGSEFFAALDELGEEATEPAAEEAAPAEAEAEDPYAAEAAEDAGEAEAEVEVAEEAVAGEPEAEATDEATPAVGVGATIHGLQPLADGSPSVWGQVVAEEATHWKLASGRIAKKETEGVKWTWAPVEEAPAEEAAEEEVAAEEPAAEEAAAEEAPVQEATAEAAVEEAPADEAPAEEEQEEEVFTGVIYQVGAKTGNMLIKCDKAQEKYGQEAMIPAKLNPAGAVVGNKIQFEVTEGKKPGGRPIAKNVKILKDNAAAIQKQIKYYFSDENLKKDRFFQNEISKTEGGYIKMSIIMGCPAIKKIGCTMQEVIDAIKEVENLEVKDAPEGEEGIRRTTPPPPLEEAPGTRFKPELTKTPDKDDIFYVGTVKSPFSTMGGSQKFFITCWEVAQQYNGLDAFFFTEQKPQGVEPGSKIVFTVSDDNKPGLSPQAAFVAAMQGPMPASMHSSSYGGGGSGGAIGGKTMPSSGYGGGYGNQKGYGKGYGKRW